MKAKIKLEGLKIESFVTDLNDHHLNTVQGGRAVWSDGDFCEITGIVCTMIASCPLIDF